MTFVMLIISALLIGYLSGIKATGITTLIVLTLSAFFSVVHILLSNRKILPPIDNFWLKHLPIIAFLFIIGIAALMKLFVFDSFSITEALQFIVKRATAIVDLIRKLNK